MTAPKVMGRSSGGTEAGEGTAQGHAGGAALARITEDIRALVDAANHAWDSQPPPNCPPWSVKRDAGCVAAAVDVYALRHLIDYALEYALLGVRAANAARRLQDDLAVVEERREEIRRRLSAA